MKTILILAAAVSSFTFTARAAEPAPSAKDLAASLSALQQDGSAFVRLKMAVKPAGGGPKTAFQLQIKQRRTKSSTEVVYQVIWPKDRAGEAVLLRQSGNDGGSGSQFLPPNTLRPLGQMKDSLFGSDLSYADVLENFFAWENQTIVGTEVVDRVNCQILESKPGKDQHSGYSGVRSWIDLRRLVPLRIEKYSATSALVRRIDTTDVAKDDMGRSIPANLTIQSPQKGSATSLEGSKIKHGVTYKDSEFTPEGIKEITPPPSAP